ncbi:hypothetical protein [Secundilactobacillus collinoides]|uniref:Uncharacterized protein n=1 Tax=Secundilactobacillus collinoides DSM 20515 = JCM 1123 TaxID=1423733 RepID=A0A0R2BA61_SECCO|nr:hypothetical protein [Secundilactobacillus collinoides]KRM76383.1 hypothetical protein FC82_GL001615 [Secundilactobacillus collinoides DSM 20515 = JCM 1123]
MSNDLANLKTLYTATKNTLLDHPLSATERSTFQTQLTALTPLGQTKQETALIDAYRELVAANLSFPIHGLFYLMNINADHTTIVLPVAPQQVQEWRVNDRHLLSLFAQNAFLFKGLPVDDTVAVALL